MQTGLLPADITPEVITLSGGVGECYRNQPADPFCFSDIGPLLATALHEHPRLREMNVQFPANRTRHGDWRGGPYALSGSTIWLEDVQLPLRNLPVAIPQDDADLVNGGRRFSSLISTRKPTLTCWRFPPRSRCVTPHYSRSSTR